MVRSLRQRLRGAVGGFSSLAREITLVLLLKMALLWLMWWAFFSEPVARHMYLEPSRVGQHLLQNFPFAVPPHAER